MDERGEKDKEMHVERDIHTYLHRAHYPLVFVGKDSAAHFGQVARDPHPSLRRQQRRHCQRGLIRSVQHQTGQRAPQLRHTGAGPVCAVGSGGDPIIAHGHGRGVPVIVIVVKGEGLV